MEVVPTILTNDKDDLGKKLDFLSDKADRVSIDVIDGKFVDEKTFPLDWLDFYHGREISWDFHLMVNNPFSWVRSCHAHLGQKIIGQIEEMGDQLDFIDRIESEGMESGLAIDLYTSIEELNTEAVFRTSIILVMAVEAGRSGQEFREESLVKIDQLTRLRENLGAGFQIGVDGGVNLSNIGILKEKLVDVVHCSSAIWNHSNWDQSLSDLQLAAR
jgi:ribulose-phosphate 3-epimerase